MPKLVYVLVEHKKITVMEYNEHLKIADNILNLLTRDGSQSSIDSTSIYNTLKDTDKQQIHQSIKNTYR